MPKNVNAAELLLGRGKLYVDRLSAAGNSTGELFLGNCQTFEITPTAEEIKHYSSADAAASLMASDVTRQDMALRIVGSQFSLANLARAFSGTEGSLAQSTADITDEVLTSSSVQGRYFKTLYRQISSVIVTGPSETPVYVVVQDYEIDAVTGRIYIVEGGDIADESIVWVDYTYADLDLNVINGMTVSSVRGFLRYVPDNTRGAQNEVEVWRASFRADGAIGFISDEYASWTLVGNVEDDSVNHPDNPHYRIIERA